MDALQVFNPAYQLKLQLMLQRFLKWFCFVFVLSYLFSLFCFSVFLLSLFLFCLFCFCVFIVELISVCFVFFVLFIYVSTNFWCSSNECLGRAIDKTFPWLWFLLGNCY